MRSTTLTTNKLIEYIKLHRLSISQDMEKIENDYPDTIIGEKEYLQGAVAALDHILEVAEEML